MKNSLIIFAALSIASLSSYAQDITGQWNGLLKVQGMEITLVFHITETESGLSSTMDSPDQGAFGIPVETTTFENSTLRLSLSAAGIEYTGEFANDAFTGTFSQMGMEIPLNLGREKVERARVIRPQDPVKPYPYNAEDIYFYNEQDSITLAGTLTFPQEGDNFPAAILITGSGPQNRDEEILGHRPFLVIADHLTRNGIAVLRFDDRGVAESEGDFSAATSYDFATDVEAAMEYLKTRKEINPDKIGLIGHSEGGVIAPIVAANRPDDINFIVLLAGTGVRGDKLLLMQLELIYRAMGSPEEEIAKSKERNKRMFDIILGEEDPARIEKEVTAILEQTLGDDEIPQGMDRERFITMQVQQIASPWMIQFIRLDPATVLEKVKCPVLALNGEKDLQVPPQENLTAIEAALHKGGNNQITLVELPGLNHLFQESETGLPSEYGTIEQTFAPVALETITHWILKQTR